MNERSQENIERQIYAQALRKATRDYEELLADLSVLRQLNDSFQAGLSFEDICHKLVQFVTETMNVENASFMVMDHEKGELRLLVGKSFYQDTGTLFSRRTWPGKTFKLGEGIAGKVAETRKSVLINDTEKDPGFVKTRGQKVNVRSILSIPLIHIDRLHGVLNLSNSEPGAFDARKEHALNIIASTVSVALSHAIVVEELRKNIKDLQETKHKLIQSDKLALLGEMLSGVAHEMNNPLAAIMGYGELVLKDESLSEQSRNMLTRLIHCAERSKKIVQGLLSFSRRTVLEKREVNINEIIDRALDRRVSDFAINNIEIVKDYGTEAATITVDPHQMEQVFLNIINNAFDSIAGPDVGGKLQVRTRAKQGSTMQIEFIDNGPGVMENHKKKLFEPFFTTKEVGKGTGLGLSISYGIIEEHGGNLYLDESYNEGARFVITLPIVRTCPAGEERDTEIETVEPPAMTARILVVDDEETIVDVMQTALAAEGFSVDCASNGEKAYEMLSASSYDLVIADLRMPGAMDGRQLFLTLAEESPETAERFVFITGDIMQDETAKFLKETGRPFLLKPFSIRDLRLVVSRTLREFVP